MKKSPKTIPVLNKISPFSSHESMVVYYIPWNYCVCEDEFGEYVTDVKRLDNGLADPNRCPGLELEKS